MKEIRPMAARPAALDATALTGAEFLRAIQLDAPMRRELFPITRTKNFMAHAAVAPLPACAREAITNYASRAAECGQFEHLHRDIEDGTRRLAAELLGAHPDEIAFAASTSAALSMVAAGLDWRPGDNVIFPGCDFPANIYPWLNLKQRGVEPRLLQPRPDGTAPTVEELRPLVDGRTRLVSLSTVHYLTGAPLAVAPIAEFLHARGVLLCLDAIQSLGALPFPAGFADFIAADAHKWLLGPTGIALLSVKREHFDKLHPAMLGWKSVANPNAYHHIDLTLPPTARRYEPGSINALGLVGLHASLQLLTRIGVDHIARHLSTLRAQLVVGLERGGFHVASPLEAERPTPITSFYKTGRDLAEVRDALDAAKVIVSLRLDPLSRQFIRVAPHFYNTAAEIDSLLAQLGRLLPIPGT